MLGKSLLDLISRPDFSEHGLLRLGAYCVANRRNSTSQKAAAQRKA
jgi:hypothetical protein